MFLIVQAITALAHIRAAVLYVMDLSEQCNHSIEEQIALFNNIKPLFTNKPIIVCLNKIDIVGVDELSEEKKKLLEVLNEDGKFRLKNNLSHHLSFYQVLLLSRKYILDIFFKHRDENALCADAVT